MSSLNNELDLILGKKKNKIARFLTCHILLKGTAFIQFCGACFIVEGAE